MAKDMLIGCVPITWPRGTPLEQVLPEIAQAGYEGAPAYPQGDRTAKETLELYAHYGLKPAPGYLGASFWIPEQEEQILERARRLGAFAAEVGCTELYVAPGGFDQYITTRGKTRSQIAGHVLPEDAMPEAEYVQFAKTLNKVGQITLEHGVKSCFHNHVSGTIETREEIDHLFSLLDRSLVFQGPDIGHLAWAGADVLQFCRDYGDSIVSLHVKDISPTVRQEGVEKDWDYRTFAEHGIFVELGEGMVDLPAMFGILRGAGYKGWVLVETDRTQKPTPLESAIISRNYLKSIGL